MAIYTAVYTATAGQTIFTAPSTYTPGYIFVFLNGVKLIDGADFAATNGTTIVLTVGAQVSDIIDLVVFK